VLSVHVPDPGCGLHIVPYDSDDKPICLITQSSDDTLGLIEFCRKRLQKSNADRTMSNIPDNRRHESATGICPLEPEVPRAARQVSTFCNDPKCGLHIVPYDSDDKPICEIVMSLNQTWMIIGRSKRIFTRQRGELKPCLTHNDDTQGLAPERSQNYGLDGDAGTGHRLGFAAGGGNP
jgi:hypothetical protein